MKHTKLRIVFGDVNLGVHGDGFSYLFSYRTGGIDSLSIENKEWLYRTPTPAFWRATTDNDRGCGFPIRSGMWLVADQFPHCTGVTVSVDGVACKTFLGSENNCHTDYEEAECVKLSYTFETVTLPSTNVNITYEVFTDGMLRVTVQYWGKKGLPELPALGWRMLIPTPAEGFRYQGLSGETYPDRMAGGIPGIYEIKGLPVTKYMVPQECGMHMKTKWLEIYRKTTKNNADSDMSRFGIRVEAENEDFAFSCLPYTPEELENATHHEELPPVRRTVLTVFGAVRGVGGIDSWGSDVIPSCRIDAEQNHTFVFRIQPLAL